MRFHSGEELFQAAELFESQPLPRGRQIGIVSNSPSVATLAAEACATRGLHLSTASEGRNPLVAGARSRAVRLRHGGRRTGRRRWDRRAVGRLRRPSWRRRGGCPGSDRRRLETGIHAGCGVGRPLRWPAAGTNQTWGAELPVPRVLRRRPCPRSRTARVALTAARRTARLPRSEPTGGARPDHLLVRVRAGRRLAVTRRGRSAARQPRNPIRRLAPLRRHRDGGGGGS